jgi:hypothetical protein
MAKSYSASRLVIQVSEAIDPAGGRDGLSQEEARSAIRAVADALVLDPSWSVQLPGSERRLNANVQPISRLLPIYQCYDDTDRHLPRTVQATGRRPEHLGRVSCSPDRPSPGANGLVPVAFPSVQSSSRNPNKP